VEFAGTGGFPMSKPKIVIDGWSKMQHPFKDRDPIWLKLYRILRHDRRWRKLSGDGCKLYIDLMLLAAEEEPLGSITLFPEDLAWEVRLTVPNLLILLVEVDDSGLIGASGYHADIKQISSGHQADNTTISLARSREVEKEKETTNVQLKVRDPSNIYVNMEEIMLFAEDFGIHPKNIDMMLDR